MKTYSKEEMRKYLSDKEWETLGMIMFDNHTIEDRQKVISMYLQLKEEILVFCQDQLLINSNDLARIDAYTNVIEKIEKFAPDI